MAMLTIKERLKKLIFPEFVDVIPIAEYPFDIKNGIAGYFKSFGDLHADKIFYVIWRDHFGSGFFSNMQHVIAHLKIAESGGMIPVVDFENFKTLYNENYPINNIMNAWEYYFHQTSPYALSEVYKSRNVFFCDGKYGWNLGAYLSDPGMFNAFSKYVTAKKFIIEKMEKVWTGIGQKGRILGVHFRGKEQNLAAGHPFCPTLRQMVGTIGSICEKHKIEKIFVVSENQQYVDELKKKFGHMIMTTESFRSGNKINAYKIYPRKDHKYLLGEEVLIDAYLLSKCHGLLHSSSNVSEFARFVNNKKYEFRYEIKNGVNSNNPFLAKYLYSIRKLLPKNCGGLLNSIEEYGAST